MTCHTTENSKFQSQPNDFCHELSPETGEADEYAENAWTTMDRPLNEINHDFADFEHDRHLRGLVSGTNRSVKSIKTIEKSWYREGESNPHEPKPASFFESAGAIARAPKRQARCSPRWRACEQGPWVE